MHLHQKEFYEMDLVLNACAFLEAKANESAKIHCKFGRVNAGALNIIKLCTMAEYYYAECQK